MHERHAAVDHERGETDDPHRHRLRRNSFGEVPQCLAEHERAERTHACRLEQRSTRSRRERHPEHGQADRVVPGIEGLLEEPAREASGYRRYDERALAKMRFIRHCRSLDIPLPEVRQLLTGRFRHAPRQGRVSRQGEQQERGRRAVDMPPVGCAKSSKMLQSTATPPAQRRMSRVALRDLQPGGV
jgi:DNA-binding transcriptional MerR regulator